MKLSKVKKLSPFIGNVISNRWIFIISALIYVGISAITRHIFHVEGYNSETIIIALASGLGIIAAVWLAYGILRLK